MGCDQPEVEGPGGCLGGVSEHPQVLAAPGLVHLYEGSFSLCQELSLPSQQDGQGVVLTVQAMLWEMLILLLGSWAGMRWGGTKGADAEDWHGDCTGLGGKHQCQAQSCLPMQESCPVPPKCGFSLLGKGDKGTSLHVFCPGYGPAPSRGGHLHHPTSSSSSLLPFPWCPQHQPRSKGPAWWETPTLPASASFFHQEIPHTKVSLWDREALGALRRCRDPSGCSLGPG